MKYCSHCGNELMDEAVVCPGCGCPVESEKTGSGLATVALVFAFLIPIVGFICGIIGAIKYKSSKAGDHCVIAIMISIAMWFIYFTIFMSFTDLASSLFRFLNVV